MFKEEVTQFCPMCEKWAEKYETLKVENEELKSKNKFWEDYCKISNPKLHKIILRDIKLKQALQEIKEIITKSCIDIDENDYIHLSHMKQILQKCEAINL